VRNYRRDLVVIRHYAYLDVASASAVWDHRRLNEALADRGNRDVGIETIARILVANRCIDPTAKSQTLPWFRRTTLPWLLNVDARSINASRIFRELTVIEQHRERICEHLYTHMRRHQPESLRSVFYDLSSTTLSSCVCSM
jgi:hypothetical protein